MRLARLDLVRYGHFTDFSLDFGAAGADGDFHLIYGPNEAGKSTLRSAWLDLLYGIPRISAYQFLHDSSALQIGAAIETGDGRIEMTRVKTGRQTLLDAAGEPVPDHVLAAALGSVDRTAYEAMFSLDDATVEEGGNDILESKGRLGEMLFAGATGLAEIGRNLGRLREAADEFHRPRARKSQLAGLISDWKEKKQEAKRLDLKSGQFDRLRKDRDAAEAARDEARETLSKARERLTRIDRLLAAQQVLAKLRRIDEELEGLADFPNLPEGWSERAADLRSRKADLTRREEETARLIERRKADLESLVFDRTVLDARDRIESADNARSGFMEADKDLPNRRAELTELEARIGARLARLDRREVEDPSTLPLPSGLTERLRRLIEARPKLQSDLETARAEREKAEREREERQADCERLGDPADPAALARLVRDAREIGIDREIERHDARVGEERLKLDRALAGLAPWEGEPERLRALPLPTRDWIATWRDEIKSARADLEKSHADLDRLRGDSEKLTAELEAIAITAGADLGGDLDATRASRRDAWSAHLAALSGAEGNPEQTASRFAAALEAELALMESRLSHAEAFAAHNKARAGLAEVAGATETAERRKTEAEAALTALGEKAEPVLSALGLPTSIGPEGLQDWLDRRAQALVLVDAADAAERDAARARATREDMDTALRGAMDALAIDCSDTASFADRLGKAEDRIARLTEQATRAANAREALLKAERAFEDRQRAEVRATEALEAWQTDWSTALGECWIGDGENAASMEGVREILTTLDGFRETVEQRDGLRHRIAAMEANRAEFEERVRAIAEDLGEAHDPDTPLASWRRLEARLAESEKTEEREKSARAYLEEAEAAREAISAERAAWQRDFNAMADRYPAGDGEELSNKIAEAERKGTLGRERAERREELAGWFPEQSVEETLALLAENAGIDALTVEREELKQRIETLDGEVAEAHHRWKSAADELAAIGGDDAVARLEEEAAVLLLQIERDAQVYLERSIGILAVERALRAFRDTHRGSMMESAARAFGTITRGRFTDLTTQPEEGEDILLGVKTDGGSITAPSMSKGTRFQLYLALRIAGYAEFAKRGQTLPFIADDILETFDDDRSAETFGLLGEMSRQGQVIYLTHHEHLCDIARDKCGDAVTVHTLPAP